MKKYLNRLCCHPLKVEHLGDLTRFYFPRLECCDKFGAIELATAQNPGVRRIETFSGDVRDTFYFLDGEEWKTEAR